MSTTAEAIEKAVKNLPPKSLHNSGAGLWSSMPLSGMRKLWQMPRPGNWTR